MGTARAKEHQHRAARVLLIGVVTLLSLQCVPFELRSILDRAGLARLTITPSSLVIPIGESVNFSATGGSSPYFFSVESGLGSIDSSTGEFTAPGSPGPVVVRVTDKTGYHVDAAVTVQAAGIPVGISPTSAIVKVNTTLTFTPFGGTPPYTFSKVGGVGSIDAGTGVYSAQSVTGPATIRVTDSSIPTPGTADATITVDNAGVALALSPATITMTVNADATFCGTGGMPPYTYTLLAGGSGSPSINGTTGYYVAGSAPGTDVVQVTDSGVPTPATATANVVVEAFATNVDYTVPSASFIASATTGDTGVAGGSFTVEASGSGNGSMNVFWKLYLSANATAGDGGDVIVASGSFAGLASGGTQVVNPTLSLPFADPGGYYLIAKVEAGDDLTTGNNSSTAGAFTLNPLDIDYQVASIDSPVGSLAGQTVTTNFRLSNSGDDGGSQTVHWTAYASTDASLTPGVDPVIDAGETSALASGATSADIAVQGSWPTTPDDYLLIVSVAADDEPVANRGDNWSASTSTTVTGAPPADVDYIVQSVGVPSPLVAGRDFSASFTYHNQGNDAGTRDVFWTAYISTDDDVLQVLTDEVAAAGTIAGGLGAHTTSGSENFTGTWPETPVTAYLFLVVSAADDANTGNNVLGDGGHLTSLPSIDYVVVSTSNSSGTVAGDSFTTESFTVRNNSIADDGAQTIYWTAYVSTNGATIDADDDIIDSGSLPALNAGETSSAQLFSGTRPAVVGTTYRLIVDVASSDEPPANAGNNYTASVPQVTTSPAVNYNITGFGVPSSDTAGSAFSMTFTMRNAGTHDGTQPVPWRAYRAFNTVLDGTEQLIDSGFLSAPGLTAGATTSPTIVSTWPASLSALNYRILVVVAAADDTLPGDNLGFSGSIPVNPLDIDYTPTTVTAPGSALVGSALNQAFTIQNAGTVMGSSTISWDVFASPGNVTLDDPGDILVASGTHAPVGAVPQVQNYAGNWPAGPGSYYLVVRLTTADDCGGANNVTPSAIVNVVASAPDYSITAVPMPAGTETGHAVSGTFTVHNGGTALGTAPVNWYAYASLGNAVYDIGDDLLQSGSFGPLPVGGDFSPAYSGIWPSAPGTYTVVIRLQVADDGTIADAASPGVGVSEPPPPDYTATFDVAIPWSGVVGTAMNLTGTTQVTISNLNSDHGHATVEWSVYLSTDMVLDTGDTLLKQSSFGPLAGPGSSTVDFGSGGVPWPGAPGRFYYFIAYVYAADDAKPSNNVVVAPHPCATGNYRYLELGENNNGTGPNPPLAQTSNTGVAAFNVNQTLVIEAAMDTFDQYDTFRFTIAVAMGLEIREMWATGFDDLDLFLWDTTVLTDLYSISVGIDSEPGAATYDVTVPSPRTCFVSANMWLANDTSGSTGKKYIILVRGLP